VGIVLAPSNPVERLAHERVLSRPDVLVEQTVVPVKEYSSNNQDLFYKSKEMKQSNSSFFQRFKAIRRASNRHTSLPNLDNLVPSQPLAGAVPVVYQTNAQVSLNASHVNTPDRSIDKRPSEFHRVSLSKLNDSPSKLSLPVIRLKESSNELAGKRLKQKISFSEYQDLKAKEQ